MINWVRSFEPWRKVMLTGALMLWIYYVSLAVLKSQGDRTIGFVVNFVGYGLLAVGFVLRMRQRREQQEALAAEREAEGDREEAEGQAPERES